MCRCRLAVLLLALVCSACGDDNGGGREDPSPTSSATISTTAGASAGGTASPTATAVVTTSSELSNGSLARAPFGQDGNDIGFASPTGNLTCALHQKAAECRAQEHSWQAPPEPPYCYEVDEGLITDPGEWGRLTVSGEPDGKANFSCGTDPMDPEDHVLHYGQYVQVGAVRCESRSNGLTCRNSKSSHGFTLSRENVSIF
jgi:hypothetical protein